MRTFVSDTSLRFESLPSIFAIGIGAAGWYTEAMDEAEKYPERTDFTANFHKAFIRAAAGDAQDAVAYVSTEIDYSLQALEYNTVTLAKAYYTAGAYAEAAFVYERYFAAMDALFEGKPAPYYDFDSGDCYMLLAQAYLAMGERERAAAGDAQDAVDRKSVV